MVKKYKKLNNISTSLKLPKTFFPNPQPDDYKEGFITRYFVQKRDTNDSPIFEVNKETYLRYYNTPIYTGVSLIWRISGNLEEKEERGKKIPSIISSNKASINKACQIIPYLNLYLVNLKQFWKPL